MEQQAGLTGYAANLRALGVPPGALISKFVSNEDGSWLVVLKPPVPGSKHGTRAPGPVSAKQAGRQAAKLLTCQSGLLPSRVATWRDDQELQRSRRAPEELPPRTEDPQPPQTSC